MNKILNPKALSEIQAQRKLEQSGDIKEQMAQLLAIVESGQVVNEVTVIEMTTMMAEILNVFEQTTIELTTMMTIMSGGM